MKMTDLRRRFESLSRLSTPDLWPEIHVREPGDPIGPSPARRVVVAVAALVVAAAGIGIAAVAFGGSDFRTVSEGSGPVAIANGPIYFRVGGAEGGSRIEAVQPDGSEQRVVFEGEPMRIAQIAWSPDGTRIAYQDPIADERGIFVADSDGSNVVRLTEGANDAWPSWSPDGTRIVFSSTRYDPQIGPCTPTGADFLCPTDIYAVDADGSDVTRLTADPAPEYQPVWAPDGDRVAFTSSPDRSSSVISVIDVEGPDRHLASTGDGGSDFRPSWSRDGTQIVFAAIRREDWGIWAVDADGSNERLILGGTGAGYVDNPVWSPDGSLIAFVGNLSIDDYSPEDALYVMRPDGTDVTSIADAPGAGVAGDIAWQPIQGPAEPVEPTTSIPPSTAEVVETFTVGHDVRSVVYGEGSVWVAASNSDGTSSGRIVRIDPETHEVQAEIPVEVIPTWEVGGGAMVVSEGSLWVTGDIEGAGVDGISDAAVIRIDATTNEVAQTFTFGGEVGADLAFMDGDLWVLIFGDETVDHTMEVVRVDPETGDVLARFQLDANWAHTLVAVDGRLITIVGGNDAVNEGGRMIVIDPADGAVSRIQMPSRYHSTTPVMSRGQVWVSLEPGFIRFDPLAEGFSEPPLTLPSRYTDCCGFIEGDDRGIWFLSLKPEGGTQLDVFGPATGDVTELVALDEGNPVAMAVAPDAVWILNYEGTLMHVSLG
jgi:Tol biopolymer transport system component